jgi:hypothetical protein
VSVFDFDVNWSSKTQVSDLSRRRTIQAIAIHNNHTTNNNDHNNDYYYYNNNNEKSDNADKVNVDTKC